MPPFGTRRRRAADGAGFSLLMAGSAARLAGAAGLIAVLWAAVGWALKEAA